MHCQGSILNVIFTTGFIFFTVASSEMNAFKIAAIWLHAKIEIINDIPPLQFSSSL